MSGLTKIKSSGFTLVELLVVMGIIALLLGITLPVLSKARGAAKRAACQGHLHAVGVGLRMYLNDNRDVMPDAARLPSAHLNDKPRFAEVMAGYLSGAETLHCPADRRNDAEHPEWSSFYDSEGSSYEYNQMLGGQKVDKSFLAKMFGEPMTPVCYDYEPFHGKRGKAGGRNYVFADGHVGQLDGESGK